MDEGNLMRGPPKLDRFADFLNKRPQPQVEKEGFHSDSGARISESEVQVVPDYHRGAMSMEENVTTDLDLIQRDFSCYASGCGHSFESREDFEMHYNSKHRYVCSICKRIFISSHLLELHVIETHDAFFAVMSKTRPMYECFLETCKQKFKNEDARFTHCIDEHKDKRPFYFPRSKSLNQPPSTNEIRPLVKSDPSSAAQSNSEMAVDMEGDVEINADSGSRTSVESSTSAKRKSSKNNVAKSMHISFGQKAGKFIPRQTFALYQKKSIQKCSSNEEKMDLSEMQEALSEFSSQANDSCSTSSQIVPEVKENMEPFLTKSIPGSSRTSITDAPAPGHVSQENMSGADPDHTDPNTDKRKLDDEGKILDIKKLKTA